MNDKIDLRPLKAKILKVNGPIRDILMIQPDHMDRDEFLTKVADWWRLLEMEGGKT